MAGKKNGGRSRRKRTHHQSTPSAHSTPSPGHPQKELKLDEVIEKVWPKLNESLIEDSEDDESDTSSEMDTVPELPEPHTSVPNMACIIAMLTELKTRMGEAPPWHCDLVAVIEQLCGRVKCLEEDHVALIASLEFTQDDLKKEKEQVETCKKDMEDMGDAMTKMGQMVGCHGVNIETLEEKATKSDIFQRGKNVLFRGVPEDRGDSMDDCLRKVDNVLSRWMDLEPSTIKVNRCHRVGPPLQGNPWRRQRIP